MEVKAFFFFSACLIAISIQTAICKDDFIASPVEFHSSKNVAENLESYEKIIDQASKFSVDIFVFPESALFTQSHVTSLVPDPKDNVTPYNDPNYNDYEPIQKLSKIAAEKKTYIVVNLREIVKSKKSTENSTENNDDSIYNTNVVFNRNGTVIARYRKYNLFDELGIKKPNEPELVTFTTDFNVTFGIFTCFDILFQKPAMDLVKKKNIKNFIFPTYWFNELPFLTASQVQAGWSYSMNVRLIAAGRNNPEMGSTGTGCYDMRQSFIQMMYEVPATQIFYCNFRQNKEKCPLQIADNTRVLPKGGDILSKELQFNYSDPTIKKATQKVLDENAGAFSENLCYSGFCCNFNVKFSKSKHAEKLNHVYKAVVYQGERPFGISTTGHVEYCAIILCQDNECGLKPPKSPYFLEFEEIKIDATFDSEDTLHFPTTLYHLNLENSNSSNLYSMDYYYFKYNSTVSGSKESVSLILTQSDIDNLITFGIYGRNFNGGNTVEFYSYLLTISVFIIYYMK